MKNAKILRRKRIEKELDPLFDYPLTIVSATMGYGKTTTVRTYLSHKKNIEKIWISLLGSDGDESVFWHKMSAAIGRHYPEIGKRLDRLGFPSDPREMTKIIELLWKWDGSKIITIVIDDYHLIEQSQKLNRFIELAAEEEIPNLHIVLLSRTRPKLNHMNLLSKGLCYYIDTNQLSFSVQEIKQYFIYMGYPSLTEKEIEKVYSYTRGWVSAIYLILLGLRKGQPITEVSDINQLVRDNLYLTLEPPVQEVLLDLSIFESFNLKQAAQVLQVPGVPQMIEQLVEQNAFIEFDRQTRVYKFHHVLLDFLKQKATDTGRDMRSVCHRAGQWYSEQGDSITAFEYYHRAGKIEELLNDLNCAEKMKVGYLVGVKILQVVVQDLKPEIYKKYPFPMLRIALSFFNSGDKKARQQCIEIIKILEDYYSKEENVPAELRNKILGEIEIINIFLAVNDTHKMVERSLNADKLLGGNVSYLVLRNSEFTFGLPHFLYAYYRQAGEIKETIDCIQKGFPPKVFDGCGTGCKCVALAEYALEIGDIKTAEIYAKKAIYKARTMGQTGIILCAYFTLMRLQLLQGNFSETKDLLVEAREQWLINPQHEISFQNSVVYNLTMSMCEGYIYGCLQSPELIPQWLQTGDISSRPLMMKGMGFPYIIYGKAVLLNRNWIELESLCESCESEYLVYHNQLGLLHNLIYIAIAKYNLYGMEQGKRVLIRALQEAQQDDIVLPFAENSIFILPILYEVRDKKELEPSYLERLIGLCEQYRDNLKAEAPLISLTERERQVIALAAQGLTNKEMADQLFLSVASIKKHLESIYAKLRVNNKASAVQRAYKEKLIK